MAKSGYTVTKSNYTLKKFHKSTTGGTVYERDFMTTNNLGGWDSGSIPNGENSFKMVYREETNAARQHHYGEFLRTENNSESWTLKDGASKSLTSESEIVINSDNGTLLSYAYYGSCVQLVQAEIRKIINNFPAEMWSKEEVIPTLNPNLYVLNNEFDIDIITEKLDSEIELEVNPLRYFCLSYNRYFVLIDGTPHGCIKTWRVMNTSGEESCYCDKQIIITTTDNTPVTIKRYWFDGKPLYMTTRAKMEIRLSENDINIFFDNLEPFQKLLLNRDTNPIYTATLDFPHETERGIETYKKKFTWPTLNGWNLDIISRKYEDYISSLLTLAEFYDEYETDNLWKNMTHDSIKNMDITFSRKGSDEDKEDYNEGTSKLQGLLWAYGRQFDEIKRYTDSISSNNTITYKEDGNIPDYFLTDTLNLAGWEVSSGVKGLATGATKSNLFAGLTKEYTVNDANIALLKNLKINSSNILSRKGTRSGIEEILGLFGYFSADFKGEENGDYSIEENIIETKVKGGGTHVFENEMLSAETFNSYKTTTETDTPENEDFDTLSGLPVLLYYYYDKNKKLKKTIIPWFKDVHEMDGQPYFQMYGGWGKISEKYSETIGYLNVVREESDIYALSKSKLLKKEFNVVYVVNVNNTGLTHYFKVIDSNEGRTAKQLSEAETSEVEIKSIISIVEEYRGNNPHTGYGNYDDGAEYLNFYKQIFHYAIDNDLFEDIAHDCNEGKLITGITEQGFTLTVKTDNKKCHYFYNKGREDVTNALGLRQMEYSDSTKTEYTDKNMKYVESNLYGNDVRGVDGTSGETNTIYVEPSIVNVKNLKITFNAVNDNEKKYIKESVLPYLMQMIPSTTILEIKYN